MRFERTADYRLLNQTLRSLGAIYDFISDDFAPALDQCVVAEHPLILYVLGYDEDELPGFWMFEPRSPILYEFHTVMPLDARALTGMRELLGPDGWLWSNTPCLRATTYIRETNQIARRFGLRAGLKEFGMDPKSTMKNQRLENRILMGTSKPGVA